MALWNRALGSFFACLSISLTGRTLAIVVYATYIEVMSVWGGGFIRSYVRLYDIRRVSDRYMKRRFCHSGLTAQWLCWVEIFATCFRIGTKVRCRLYCCATTCHKMLSIFHCPWMTDVSPLCGNSGCHLIHAVSSLVLLPRPLALSLSSISPYGPFFWHFPEFFSILQSNSLQFFNIFCQDINTSLCSSCSAASGLYKLVRGMCNMPSDKVLMLPLHIYVVSVTFFLLFLPISFCFFFFLTGIDKSDGRVDDTSRS